MHAVAAPFSMSAAALEELAEKAEALAGRVSSRATKASDEFEEDEEEDDASYFKMKQELLTTYCGMLSYYLCRKARGESIQDHPVVRRLYELRLTFEKLRLLDAKLRHQLDKVLARADAADVAPVANLESVEIDKEEGTYKPPRSTVAYHEQDEPRRTTTTTTTRRRGRRPRSARRPTRARRAEIDFMRERFDAPAEWSGGHDEARDWSTSGPPGTAAEGAAGAGPRGEFFPAIDTNKKKKKRGRRRTSLSLTT